MGFLVNGDALAGGFTHFGNGSANVYLNKLLGTIAVISHEWCVPPRMSTKAGCRGKGLIRYLGHCGKQLNLDDTTEFESSFRAGITPGRRRLAWHCDADSGGRTRSGINK